MSFISDPKLPSRSVASAFRTSVRTASSSHVSVLQTVSQGLPNALTSCERYPFETADTLHRLLVAAAAEVDFADALESAVRPQVGRAGFELRIDVTGNPAADIRSLVLPMARELVLNAAKHAGAAHVRVLAGSEMDGTFVLEVRDDGLGMPADRLGVARRTGHHGIAALQRRVRGLGGRVEVESTQGEGTTVTVHLPSSGLRAVEV